MANADGEKSHWHRWWILVSSDFACRLEELYGPSMDCQGSVSTWAQSAGSSLARFAGSGNAAGFHIMTLNFSIALNGLIYLPSTTYHWPINFYATLPLRTGKKKRWGKTRGKLWNMCSCDHKTFIDCKIQYIMHSPLWQYAVAQTLIYLRKYACLRVRGVVMKFCWPKTLQYFPLNINSFRSKSNPLCWLLDAPSRARWISFKSWL